MQESCKHFLGAPGTAKMRCWSSAHLEVRNLTQNGALSQYFLMTDPFWGPKFGPQNGVQLDGFSAGQRVVKNALLQTVVSIVRLASAVCLSSNAFSGWCAGPQALLSGQSLSRKPRAPAALHAPGTALHLAPRRFDVHAMHCIRTSTRHQELQACLQRTLVTAPSPGTAPAAATSV